MTAATATTSCSVWWAQSAEGSHLTSILDPVERSLSERFLSGADRDRFLTGAVLLRVAAADALGKSPESLQIERACPRCGKPHGKPRIAESGLEVSVAHSGGSVVVALSFAGAVGVDVEEIRSIDYHLLLAGVLDESEQGSISSDEDFFVCWTRKESALKATGDGLRVDMSDVVVAPPRTAPALVRYEGRAVSAFMADLPAPRGYAAAVTLLTSARVAVRETAAGSLSSY